MKNTKLVRFLILFNVEEFKKFGLFVRSPYYNRLNNVIKLYDTLKKYYPEFDGRNFTKENVFKNIFPGEKYNDIKLRALSSYLFSLAEKFLAAEKYLENNISVRLDILEAALKKEDRHLASKQLESVNLLLPAYKTRNEEYYLTLFKVLFQRNVLSGYFSGKMNFQKEIDALTVYFIATVLRTSAVAFHTQSMLQVNIRTDLTELVIKLAETEPYNRIPVVKMNYALYMITKNTEDEKYFFRFVSLLEKHPFVYSSRELSQEIYHLLINFCIIKIQKGFKKYIKAKLDLCKLLLSQKIQDAEEYFPLFFFHTIIASALQNNDTEFAERFIEEYKGKLDPKISRDIIELSYAKLHYHSKRYDKALGCLAKISDSEDIFLKLAWKDLYIKTFYENDDYEQVFSIIDSYKHFLYKNPLLSSEVKKRYQVYLNMTRELLRLKLIPDKNKLREMKKTLENIPGFVNKDWIEEKLKEI